MGRGVPVDCPFMTSNGEYGTTHHGHRRRLHEGKRLEVVHDGLQGGEADLDIDDDERVEHGVGKADSTKHIQRRGLLRDRVLADKLVHHLRCEGSGVELASIAALLLPDRGARVGHAARRTDFRQLVEDADCRLFGQRFCHANVLAQCIHLSAVDREIVRE